MNQTTNLFLVVVFTMLLTKTTSFKINKCISPFEGKHGNYEIYCSYISAITIKCNKQIIQSLPNIKVNWRIVSAVLFSNCTFSQTSSVQSTLLSMGVHNFNSIGFFYFGNSPNRLSFQNLSCTVVLRISHINELPYDLFYDVLKVRMVFVEETKITRIPKDFFNDWAKNVEVVSLNSNKLRKIARGDFSRLINVAKLHLTNNEIDEIESGAFDHLTHLVELELGKNRFRSLPPGSFKQLTYLTRITLESRTMYRYYKPEECIMFEMTSLPSNLFRRTYNLNVIQLIGHNLKSLPLGLFDDNERLKILDIRENCLQFLPPGIFKGLKRLTILLIGGNRLTSVLPEVFIGMQSLKYLYVQKNNLTRIDAHIFNYLKSAVEIDFSRNQITAIEYRINGKPQFESESTHTNISEIPNFQRLELLNLSSNYLTDLDVIPFLSHGYFNFNSNTNLHYEPLETEFIEQLKLAKTVDLNNNHISKVNFTALSSAMAKLDQFHIRITETGKISPITVYLANNSLHCDCNLMDFIRYLNGSSHQVLKKYWIILSRGATNFGAEFTCSSPSELKNRNVRKVLLEEFHCLVRANTFGDTCIDTCVCQQYPEKKILSVDCSFRNLTQLPKIKNSLHNWSIVLNMSSNAVLRIPPLNNSYFVDITDLDLSSNKISELSLDAFSPNLRVLKLHNNSISRLDSNVIQYLESENPLRSLTIHDNTFTCGCETHKILQSSIRKKLSGYNFHEVLCHGKNRKLYEVTVDELCEDTIILIVSVSSFFAFLGILISSLAALYYRYQKQIKIWLYSKQFCLWCITEDELDKDKNYDAFVSFSHKDEDFVETEIVAKLEAGHRPYKLCLHYRDWLAGEWIPLQISRSVKDSRRTIIILTPDFLESVWGLIEFRAAHTQALEEGRARLIVILHGELGNIDELNQELKDYLNSNTCIKWGDPSFWQKLKYALPHRPRGSPIIDNSDTVHYRVNNHSEFGVALQSHFSSIAPHASSK